MAFAGPEPKDKKHGRTPDAGWTDVPDVPFDGPGRLDLPKRRGLKWHDQVVRWWEVLSRMPHCCLWEESDWLFALETAFMKLDWWRDFEAGNVVTSKSTEIRRREDLLGVTVEARRKLRIRYVSDEAEADDETVSAGAAEGVAQLDERRRRIRAS